MWTYLGISFVTKIDRPPEIEDCLFTKPLFLYSFVWSKMFLRLLQQIFEFTYFADKGRLHKVRPFLDSLASKLYHMYVPEK
jgi:hypothetical protein